MWSVAAEVAGSRHPAAVAGRGPEKPMSKSMPPLGRRESPQLRKAGSRRSSNATDCAEMDDATVPAPVGTRTVADRPPRPRFQHPARSPGSHAAVLGRAVWSRRPAESRAGLHQRNDAFPGPMGLPQEGPLAARNGSSTSTPRSARSIASWSSAASARAS